MLHFVYADQACDRQKLIETMFKSRAKQFRERLAWNVTVDEEGHEKDEYDRLNPLYLIVGGDDEVCKGSMRFLPTTGDTMINKHFTKLTGGVTIKSPFIWECTRFCLAPEVRNSVVATEILFGTLELGIRCDLKFFVGVFSKPMIRIYNRIGWSPHIIGEGELGEETICAGLWPVSMKIREDLMLRHNWLNSLLETPSELESLAA